MLGASSEVVIADAVARGVPDAGGADAWPLLRAEAMDPVAPPAGRGERDDVDAYMQYGFVPMTMGRSVSNTTEYAADDYALANLAAALGNTADHDTLLARSHGWRVLFDPSVGFLRGKNPDGTFPATAFDPFAMTDDYAEADAWQSLWMAGSQDPDGMVAVFGGTDAVIAKLTDFFAKSKTDWETSDPSAANFPRKWYWAGNEPDIAAPFLFAQLGHPELTQEWSRWIEDTIYSDQPDGVPGNDDGGAMGSWYVLATLGLYPIPGGDQWIIGGPKFPKARIVVGGHELVIDTEGQGVHVASASLDGVTVTTATISHAQLAGASKLHFVLRD
jgi:predicted alpha-1,2-mannosidase